jgi:hypothetical protein
MNDVAFLVFTNEHYFDLLNLTLPYTIENTKHLDKKIYLVSNKIPEHNKFDGINYIDTNVPFEDDGGHFKNVLFNALNQIPEKYVLFLCDDYLLRSPIKKDKFDSIINIIEDTDADFLSLSTQKHYEMFLDNWNKPFIDPKYGLPSDCIYEMDEKVRHLYSVQPCIWKVSSLIQIIQTHITKDRRLALHDLDNTNILTKNGEYRELQDNTILYDKRPLGYNFKNLCIHHPPDTYNFDEKNIGSEYFVIDYCEIIRGGKFIQGTNSIVYLNEILSTNNNIKNKLERFF